MIENKYEDENEDHSSKPIPHQRLIKRIQILRKWWGSVVPPEYVAGLPTSLRALGRWKVQSLGIEAMTDPHSLKRTNADWGDDVDLADRLMTALQERLRLPQAKKNVGQQAAELRVEKSVLEGLLRRTVSQWHEAREKASRASKLADFHAHINEHLEDRIKGLESTLSERDEQLAEVRRELARLQSSGRLLLR